MLHDKWGLNYANVSFIVIQVRKSKAAELPEICYTNGLWRWELIFLGLFVCLFFSDLRRTLILYWDNLDSDLMSSYTMDDSISSFVDEHMEIIRVRLGLSWHPVTWFVDIKTSRRRAKLETKLKSMRRAANSMISCIWCQAC